MLTIELHSDAPMLRDVRGNAYTTFSLDRDFRRVREADDLPEVVPVSETAG